VYRVGLGDETLYFRVAESLENDLAPELHVHETLCERGCQVPRVIAYSPIDPDIGRTVAVLGEIPGEPVGWRPALDRSELASVLRAAGRDLAIMNAIDVEGFGWIRRDLGAGPLRAEHRSYEEWLHGETDEGIESCLDALADHLTGAERAGIRAAAAALVGDSEVRPVLVHGDFDVTHIFHERGRYTGLIDFGEIRGAEPWYDLSLFWRLHSGYAIGRFMYAQVVVGYFEGRQRPDAGRIRHTALLIALRFAARRTAVQGHDWLRENPDLGGLTQIRALAPTTKPGRTRASISECPVRQLTRSSPWVARWSVEIASVACSMNTRERHERGDSGGCDGTRIRASRPVGAQARTTAAATVRSSARVAPDLVSR